MEDEHGEFMCVQSCKVARLHLDSFSPLTNHPIELAFEVADLDDELHILMVEYVEGTETADLTESHWGQVLAQHHYAEIISIWCEMERCKEEDQ